MRELKFRLWLPSLQKLSYDSFMISPLGKVYVISNGDFMSGKRHLWDLDNIIETKDYVLQQFTGAKDLNGNEIYEGDILSSEVNEKPCNYIVKWADEYKDYVGFGLNPVMKNPPRITYFIHDFKMWMVEGFKIIGNINQNPELCTQD